MRRTRFRDEQKARRRCGCGAAVGPVSSFSFSCGLLLSSIQAVATGMYVCINMCMCKHIFNHTRARTYARARSHTRRFKYSLEPQCLIVLPSDLVKFGPPGFSLGHGVRDFIGVVAKPLPLQLQVIRVSLFIGINNRRCQCVCTYIQCVCTYIRGEVSCMQANVHARLHTTHAHVP